MEEGGQGEPVAAEEERVPEPERGVEDRLPEEPKGQEERKGGRPGKPVVPSPPPARPKGAPPRPGKHNAKVVSPPVDRLKGAPHRANRPKARAARLPVKLKDRGDLPPVKLKVSRGVPPRDKIAGSITSGRTDAHQPVVHPTSTTIAIDGTTEPATNWTTIAETKGSARTTPLVPQEISNRVRAAISGVAVSTPRRSNRSLAVGLVSPVALNQVVAPDCPAVAIRMAALIQESIMDRTSPRS